MMSLLLLILLDPLCVLAALGALLLGLQKACRKRHPAACPVRICKRA